MHQRALTNIKKKAYSQGIGKITFSRKDEKWLTPQRYTTNTQYVLYTDSRIMYIAKFKNPTHTSREKQNRIDCRIITNCSTNYNH